MSDTPETDAFLAQHYPTHPTEKYVEARLGVTFEGPLKQILRRLKRERDEAREALAKINEDNKQERGAILSSDLFGSFKAVPWDDGIYVITCNAGAIGRTIDERTAQWLPSWLNWAMAEAVAKLPNSVLNNSVSNNKEAAK